MINFVELHSSEIKEHFPSFYHNDDAYFEINKSNDPIGVISIRSLTFRDTCNFGVYMYEKHKLTKNIITEAFKIPFDLGFKKILFTTTNKTVSTFLDYMGKHGINYLCTIFGNKYYLKGLS